MKKGALVVKHLREEQDSADLANLTISQNIVPSPCLEIFSEESVTFSRVEVLSKKEHKACASSSVVFFIRITNSFRFLIFHKLWMTF